MNFSKNPKQARKMAKEAAKLRKIANKNPERLQGQELAKARRELLLENYDEEQLQPKYRRELSS